jgi:predicted O-methyltransferase YrrM
MPVDISKAVQIDGWMSIPELLWLAEQAQSRKVIVEIGSFLGRSTRALADNTNGFVYAVDDWYGPRDEHVEIWPSHRKQLFDLFSENMEGLQGKLNVVRKDHSNLGAGDIPCSPDMVFIDGDHQKESVERDIKYWLTKMAPGGLICGHDYHDRDDFPGVRDSVKKFFPIFSVAPNTSIWFVEISPHPFKTSA